MNDAMQLILYLFESRHCILTTTLIGVCFFLLFVCSLVSDDTYSLPIAAALPSSYLLPYNENSPSIHFRHGGLKSFNCRIRTVSSIMCQDDGICTWVQTWPNAKELVTKTLNKTSNTDERLIARLT